MVANTTKYSINDLLSPASFGIHEHRGSPSFGISCAKIVSLDNERCSEKGSINGASEACPFRNGPQETHKVSQARWSARSAVAPGSQHDSKDSRGPHGL